MAGQEDLINQKQEGEIHCEPEVDNGSEAGDTSEALKLGKGISATSSYGPDSPEVKKMEEAFDKGIPIVIYEFMQGMVDYGKNHTPPPRIVIIREDGTREIFNGTLDVQDQKNPITSVEFSNYGPGLSPEDTVIIRHEGKGVAELGTHGRGTTVSLAFLASKGMPVSISSNYQGTDWQLSTSLIPTEARTTSILGVKGKWGAPNKNPKTCFKIDNPSQEFCEMLSKISDYFLYANPKSSKALLVDKSEDKLEEESVKMDKGEVVCMGEGALPDGGELYRNIFIDGLRLPLAYSKTALPWSIMNFPDKQSDILSRDGSHWRRVGRSHDSSSVESESNLENILPLIVRKMKNRKFLETLIKKALIKRDRHASICELKDVEDPFDEGTKEIIQAIWREKYDGALIEDKESNVQKFRRLHGEEQKITLMDKDLYLFLAKAGILTVSAYLGVENSVSFSSLNTMKVPSALKENSLEIMIKGIAERGGNVDKVKVKGKKKLRISFPEIIKEKGGFNGETESSIGPFLRVIAIILSAKKIDSEIFCKEIDCFHELKITPSSEKWAPDSFSTDIDIHTYNETDQQFSEYITYENGNTYILIDEDDVNMREPNFLDKLIEYFQKLSKELEARMKKYKVEGAKPNAKASAQAKVASSKATDGVGQNRKEKVRDPIDVMDSRNVLDSENNPYEKGDKPFSMEKTHWPVGYYKESTGSNLAFDEVKGTVRWESDETWIKEEIKRKVPLRFSSKTVLYNLEDCEMERLEILTGNKIVGFVTIPQNADVRFFREKRTGTYYISGSAEKVSYYTKLDKESDYENNPPLEEEEEDVLADKSMLIQEWREVINYINSNSALTVEAKLKLLIKEWRGKFVYSKRYGLNEQNKGSSREEVAAKIVNTSKGICNISATGFAILLRSVGIPSRICGGYWNQGRGHGGSHMWLEYWDNGQWVPMESEIGTVSEKEAKEVELSENLIKTPSKKISLIQVTVFAAVLGVLGAGGAYEVKQLGGVDGVQKKVSALLHEIASDLGDKNDKEKEHDQSENKSLLYQWFCE